MIRISFNGSDKRVAAALSAKHGQVESAAIRTMTTLMLRLQRKVVSEKLSGQVLAQRSGRLAGSVHVEPTDNSGGKITGKVTAAGGTAWYGQVHEYGGRGAYDIKPVNKKALAFFPGGSLGAGGGIVPLKRSEISGLYKGGKGGTLRSAKLGQFSAYGGVVVQEVHHPALPARPFMRPSLDEMRDEIIETLRRAITLELVKKG